MGSCYQPEVDPCAAGLPPPHLRSTPAGDQCCCSGKKNSFYSTRGGGKGHGGTKYSRWAKCFTVFPSFVVKHRQFFTLLSSLSKTCLRFLSDFVNSVFATEDHFASFRAVPVSVTPTLRSAARPCISVNSVAEPEPPEAVTFRVEPIFYLAVVESRSRLF